MSATISYLPINPHILSWARDRCAISIEEAARHIGVTVERVQDWEDGTRYPTVRQARKLGDFYDVPFLEFFGKNPPPLSMPKLVPDFRSLTTRVTDKDRFALTEVQRWAEEQRLNALDLIELLGDVAPGFPEELHANLSHDPEVVADRARAIMRFDLATQMSFKSEDLYKFPQYIRTRIEASGVIVLKQSGINRLGVRGMCIYDNPLPVIVYGNEMPGGQVFTLAHEFAHIIVRRSGVSGPPRMGGRNGDRFVETWCNHFAAAFLMPKGGIVADMEDFEKNAESISDDVLTKMAKRYSVSQHAMLIRLVVLGYVRSRYYWSVKRSRFLAEEKVYEAFGRPKYYGQRYRSSRGDFYTGLVVEAWNTGRITNHSAAEFMGIKRLSHLDDIRANFG